MSDPQKRGVACAAGRRLGRGGRGRASRGGDDRHGCRGPGPEQGRPQQHRRPLEEGQASQVRPGRASILARSAPIDRARAACDPRFSHLCLPVLPQHARPRNRASRALRGPAESVKPARAAARRPARGLSDARAERAAPVGRLRRHPGPRASHGIAAACARGRVSPRDPPRRGSGNLVVPSLFLFILCF